MIGMNKYINADELKRKRYIIETHRNPFTGEESETVTGERLYVTYAEIDEMPSADVRENIHGEWQRTNPMTDTVECSLCHYQIISEELITPFCPWCGADMRCRK